MTYVVEIEDKHGRRAIKDYEASSPYDLVGRVRCELKPYPDFKPVGAWCKDQPKEAAYLRNCIAGGYWVFGYLRRNARSTWGECHAPAT